MRNVCANSGLPDAPAYTTVLADHKNKTDWLMEGPRHFTLKNCYVGHNEKCKYVDCNVSKYFNILIDNLTRQTIQKYLKWLKKSVQALHHQ